MIEQFDTIAAIATSVGEGGIGVVKISGSRAIPAALSLFRPSKKHLSEDLLSHKMYHGHIVSPESSKIIDEVLLVAMKAPHSYTGEDVAEIHAHGSRTALFTILELLLKTKGLRLAEPGEFTKRAFLNGRIDLAQAEAVIDVISARSQKSLEIASCQLSGKLTKIIESERLELIKILSEIEAAIDFFDEADYFDAFKTKQELNNIEKSLQELLRHYHEGHFYREGISTVIAGRPNVGKSSLMNALLEKERAIVTAFPGTTRDVVEETINISGIPLVLADTAGLRKTDDIVESVGIRLTKQRLSQAELVLFVIDGSENLTEEDHQIYKEIKGKRVLLVVNKRDLLNDKTSLNLPLDWNAPAILISARYGSGIDELKAAIFNEIMGCGTSGDVPVVVPNLRHKIAIERALAEIDEALKGLAENIEPDLLAINIRAALDYLGEIVGLTVTDDILDRIFSQFCIGK